MSRRCVFLDRDGVINVKQPDGQYVCDWSQFEWIPQTIDWIRLFNTLDFAVIVVTNQRAVAKGLITMESLDEIHARMVAELADRDAVINDVMVCPHEQDSCGCRKPKPGMIHAACQKWDLEIRRSIMIGDSDSDRLLAEACGMSFVEVLSGTISRIQMSEPNADVVD